MGLKNWKEELELIFAKLQHYACIHRYWNKYLQQNSKHKLKLNSLNKLKLTCTT